jgi:phage shock protein C
MSEEVRKLYRTREGGDRMIFGVAGGLGRFLTLDPTVVRLLFILSLIFGGAGLWIYLVMWIVVPEEPA